MVKSGFDVGLQEFPSESYQILTDFCQRHQLLKKAFSPLQVISISDDGGGEVRCRQKTLTDSDKNRIRNSDKTRTGNHMRISRKSEKNCIRKTGKNRKGLKINPKNIF